MYNIERKFFQTEKPTWILQVLLALKPTTFEKTESIARARENLKNIGEVLQHTRCNHYGKYKPLLSIRNIIESDNSITVTTCSRAWVFPSKKTAEEWGVDYHLVYSDGNPVENHPAKADEFFERESKECERLLSVLSKNS